MRLKTQFILQLAALVCISIFGCQTNDMLSPSPVQSKLRLSGRIIGRHGAPVSGIRVSAGSFTTATDSTGQYIFATIPKGHYTITPESKNFTFYPLFHIIDIDQQDIGNQDFFLDYPLPMDMTIIPSGTFFMGSNNGNINERPVHAVTIKSFAIGKYEIIQEKWEKIMGNNPTHFKGDSLAVEQVSWFDAITFCNNLSLQEGLKSAYTIDGANTVCDFSSEGYRLPTEAEWEYACRCGTATDYYSGDRTSQNTGRYIDLRLDSIGWYNANSQGESHQVGQKPANRFGLYDITGNVFEWCWDWRGDYPSISELNPTGPSNGSIRICRGGSWYYVPYESRSAFRLAYSPTSKYSGVGFRVVRSIQ